jgi:NAD(P)-dependent dehydrogenase (short-subunit alcohol dehydrogenase family)
VTATSGWAFAPHPLARGRPIYAPAMTIEDFTGKVAVVTGGASGIGRGMARAFAAEGADVVVADIDEPAAEQTAAELRASGVRAASVALDVRDRASVDALADVALREMGGVDIVANNAGVFLRGPMSDTTEDDWQFVLSINLDGMFRVGQTFAAILRDRGSGHIVNTASVGGFLSSRECVAYAVSKFGVVAYSEALRAELAPLGIGVSTLCPGPIDTNLTTSDKLRPDGDRRGGYSSGLEELVAGGMKPDDVGPIVVAGIRRNSAYIFTHDYRQPFRQRFDAVLADFDHVPRDA